MADYTPTQKAVLDKAKERFLRDGFESASLRQIVKDAGFKQGAFYGYYNSGSGMTEAISILSVRKSIKRKGTET